MWHHTLSEAATEARKLARRHLTVMAIVWEKDEHGEGYGWCPAASVDILYGVQIRAGLAKVVDTVRYLPPVGSIIPVRT